MEFRENLNFGGTSKVTKAIIKDNTIVNSCGTSVAVVKEFSSKISDDSFRYEIAIMASLPNNPHIARFIGYSDNPRSIVLKFYPGNLSKLALEKPMFMNPIECISVAKSIAAGMSVIHDHNIIHFDLKPDNILFDFKSDGSIVYLICDFGFAKFVSTPHSNFVAGLRTPNSMGVTPRYAAPELCEKISDQENSLYTREKLGGYGASISSKKVDVYSYAMTLYFAVSGDKPWSNLKPDTIEELIIRGERPSTEDIKKRHTVLTNLIQRCWDHNPEKRPDFSEICTMLHDQ